VLRLPLSSPLSFLFEVGVVLVLVLLSSTVFVGGAVLLLLLLVALASCDPEVDRDAEAAEDEAAARISLVLEKVMIEPGPNTTEAELDVEDAVDLGGRVFDVVVSDGTG